MSWQNHITSIVRVLINDISEPYEYSDERIQQAVSIAAKYVQLDVDLDNKYTIDVVNYNISPDPTINNDDIFLGLVSLKTACIFDQGTFRTKAALEGIRTSLGPANISFGGSLQGWQSIIDHGACATYQQLTDHWEVKNASAVQAILSPFVGNKFDPQSAIRGATHRNSHDDFYA